jgi:hypothetical protein
MIFWFKVFLLGLLGCSSLLSMAQADASNLPSQSESNLIEAQRLVLAEEKKKVFEQFQANSKACWQKFAVNDCLSNVRQQKYQSLRPLDQREIELNTRQRALKEIERRQRLSDKIIDNSNDKAPP